MQRANPDGAKALADIGLPTLSFVSVASSDLIVFVEVDDGPRHFVRHRVALYARLCLIDHVSLWRTAVAHAPGRRPDWQEIKKPFAIVFARRAIVSATAARAESQTNR